MRTPQVSPVASPSASPSFDVVVVKSEEKEDLSIKGLVKFVSDFLILINAKHALSLSLSLSLFTA